MSATPDLSVSVVIPAWNNAHFLAEAIHSALSVAAEIIVVDDASTDGTPAQALQEFSGNTQVRSLRLDGNLGPAGARVAGLELASGDCIGFLDSDDRYAHGALELLRLALQGNPTADIAMGRKIGLYCQSDSSYATSGDVVRMYSLGSALARRTLLERVCIDAKIRHGEDIDWFMRIQEAQTCFELVDDVVQEYRRHTTNLTKIEEGGSKNAELADVMARSMFRRRKLAKQRGVAIDEIYYVQPDSFSS